MGEDAGIRGTVVGLLYASHGGLHDDYAVSILATGVLVAIAREIDAPGGTPDGGRLQRRYPHPHASRHAARLRGGHRRPVPGPHRLLGDGLPDRDRRWRAGQAAWGSSRRFSVKPPTAGTCLSAAEDLAQPVNPRVHRLRQAEKKRRTSRRSGSEGCGFGWWCRLTLLPLPPNCAHHVDDVANTAPRVPVVSEATR